MNNNRISFGAIKSVIDVPDLLNIQTETFEEFIQLEKLPEERENKGLQKVFVDNFPIFDNKENYRLDFINYNVEKARFSVEECMERGLNFCCTSKSKAYDYLQKILTPKNLLTVLNRKFILAAYLL